MASSESPAAPPTSSPSSPSARAQTFASNCSYYN